MTIKTESHYSAYIYGKLLSAMTKADNRILSVEDANVEAFLECLFPNHSQDALTSYQQERNVFYLNDIDHHYAAQLMHLPTPAKLELLRTLWSVAMCDGELHTEEEVLLLNIAKHLLLKTQDVQKIMASK